MLKLIQTDWGQFDLAPINSTTNDIASDETTATVETLIYAALFTDAEAPENRVADRYERRGWWADKDAGNGLWYVRRQGLSPAARREAKTIIKRVLESHSEAFQDIEITEVPPNTAAPLDAGNSSSVQLSISGLHNGQKFIVQASL